MSPSQSPNSLTLRQGIYDEIDPKNFVNAFRGKVALVTGSGRGIGRDIAVALVTSGAAVAVTARTKGQVDDTVKYLMSLGEDVKVLGIVADGCVHEDLQRLVQEVSNKLGEIDILICNAGTNTFMPFHMTDADSWWRDMEINLRFPVELTRMVLPTMQKRNSGILIYTSSRAANANLPWTTSYNCSKTALSRFAGTLQVELDTVQCVEGGFHGNGIETFSIHPGEIETELHQTAFPEQTKRDAKYVVEHMEKIGKKRPHFSSDLPAWTCVFLASGRARKLKGQFVDCTRDIGEAIAQSAA